MEDLKRAKSTFDSERRRREDEEKRYRTETAGLQDQIKAMLTQHQQLVEQMTQRDGQVIIIQLRSALSSLEPLKEDFSCSFSVLASL